jgi:hypothetical protein
MHIVSFASQNTDSAVRTSDNAVSVYRVYEDRERGPKAEFAVWRNCTHVTHRCYSVQIKKFTKVWTRGSEGSLFYVSVTMTI